MQFFSLLFSFCAQLFAADDGVVADESLWPVARPPVDETGPRTVGVIETAPTEELTSIEEVSLEVESPQGPHIVAVTGATGGLGVEASLLAVAHSIQFLFCPLTLKYIVLQLADCRWSRRCLLAVIMCGLCVDQRKKQSQCCRNLST